MDAEPRLPGELWREDADETSWFGGSARGCVLNMSKTLERAHCRSQVLGVDDVVPLEHRARAVPAHPHDDRLRDADSARPGDEAPTEVGVTKPLSRETGTRRSQSNVGMLTPTGSGLRPGERWTAGNVR